MEVFTDLVALDIGTSSIKLVSVASGSGKHGYKVKRGEVENIPEGLIAGGFTDPSITDIELFKKILKKLLKRRFSLDRGVIIGLPDRWVKLHILQNMKLSEAEKKNPQFLEWRLEKMLPLPEDMDVNIDFQVLGKNEVEIDETKDVGYSVLAAAVKKDIIELISVITADLNVEVMAYDTSTLGIYNVFESLNPDRCVDRSIIHCHVGHEATIVRVFKEGAIVYERIIEVAGEEFTKIISEIDDVNFETAQKTKESEIFFPTNKEEIIELIPKRERIERIFGNWLREINVTFRFFQEKFKIQTLPSVFLTGGGAMFKGLPQFLTEYFSTNFIVFNPIEEMPVSGKPDVKKNKLGPQLAPGIGLLTK